jgi:plasmid maintenance system killer protein
LIQAGKRMKLMPNVIPVSVFSIKISRLTFNVMRYILSLKGSRTGQHSIRINDQWRVCFLWLDGDAIDVEIVDYH